MQRIVVVLFIIVTCEYPSSVSPCGHLTACLCYSTRQAEQAALQQWIDDIREAHHDEMDALQHERDAALADEVMTSQAAIEAMRAKHVVEVERERSKAREMQEKADLLLQVERDLLLHA